MLIRKDRPVRRHLGHIHAAAAGMIKQGLQRLRVELQERA
jgi:hypothetical protein